MVLFVSVIVISVSVVVFGCMIGGVLNWVSVC